MATINDLPRQRLPKSKKTKSWGISVIDDLEKLSYTDSYNGRSTKYRKQVNFDLYNGRINKEDFEYVINPYNFKKDEFPANLQHYDICSPKINLLLGEEIRRPFNFRAVATNPEAISEVEEQQKQFILGAYREYIEALALGEDTTNQEKRLQDLDKYMKYSYSDMYERTANHILKYLTKEQNLVYKFNQGFKDALIAGEEIYWTGIVAGEPVCRNVNPLDITVIQDPDSDFVDDATAIIEERWLTLPTILDEYYKSLTDTQVRNLERKYAKNGGQNFGADTIEYPSTTMIIKGDSDTRYKNELRKRSHDSDGTIRVLRCEWKSQRKVGFLYSIDDSGIEEVELVDELFEVPEYAEKDKDGFYHFDDMRLQWLWISEYWEGTKIGDDEYTDIQPRQNQRRSLDNPSLCKSGYTGLIYNARNSESVSLIDRMKPYQYLYNITFYRLELAMAKTKGKVALMDVSQIPGGENWDTDKWMYYLDAMGIMFINSMEEGKRGEKSTFNQFQSIDLTMGNYIQTHIAILSQLEDKMGQLSGVSRQREGQTQASELVGNVERSISQSSHITEVWFYNHNEVKRRVMEAMLDTARIAWRKGKKINYVTDDLGRHLLQVNGSEFASTQHGISISNTAKDNKAIETARSLLQAGLQSDKIQLSEAVTVLQSDSLSDIRMELLEGERRKAEEQRQVQEAQTKSAEQINQAQIQDKQADRDLEREKNIRDNETKLAIAFKSDSPELQDNSLEIEKLNLEKEKHKDKIELDKEKLRKDVEQNVAALGLKKQELKIKEKAANKPTNNSK